MVIYRPHRGGLDQSMLEVKEFNSFDDMKKYIIKQWDNYFSVDDIVIMDEQYNDERIGWKDTRDICTKKFGEQDNISLYGIPQCIGMCATEY